MKVGLKVGPCPDLKVEEFFFAPISISLKSDLSGSGLIEFDCQRANLYVNQMQLTVLILFFIRRVVVRFSVGNLGIGNIKRWT